MKRILLLFLLSTPLFAVSQWREPIKFPRPDSEINRFKFYQPWAFPNTDSLRNYNTKWIDNNAAKAFTNLRLHYLIDGIIDFLDVALQGSGGSGLYGIDSLAKVNDTTLRYRKNGVFHNLIFKGQTQTLQQVLNNGSTLTANNTITLLDSLSILSGKLVLDSLRIRNAPQVTDTAGLNIATLDEFGQAKRLIINWSDLINIIRQVGFGLVLDSEAGEVSADTTRGTGLPSYHYVDSIAGTAITNASGSGDTLLTADNTIKRIRHDATITVSTNSNALLLGADTISYVSTPAKLRDTAAAVRSALEDSAAAIRADMSAGVSKFGTINSQSYSPKGGVVDGDSINLQYANVNFPGIISTDTQTIKGYKIFNDTAQASKLLMGGRLVLIGQQDVDPANQRSLQYASDGSRPAVMQVVATDAVLGGDSTNARGIEFSVYDNSTGGNFIHAKKARGNWKNPSGVQAGDILFGEAAWGYCGNVSNFSGSAIGYHMVATENFTSTANGTEFQFFTTKRGQQSGSGRSWNLIMKDDGSNVSIRDSIKAGTLTGNNPALYVSATLPSANTAAVNGATMAFTGNGSAAFAQQGLAVSYTGGFSGGTLTNAFNATSTTTNSNTSFDGLTASYRPIGNRAINATMISTTTGYNTGTVSIAQGGNMNIGVWGTSTITKNNAANVGVAGVALNGGTGTATATAGFFALQDKGTTAPVFSNGVIVADNGSTVHPIFVGRVNETEKIRIASGGELRINTTGGSANIDMRRLYVNGSVGVNKDSIPILTTTAPDYMLTLDTTNNRISRRVLPKKYVALLSQSGTADPTVDILENNIGSIVWTRIGEGLYAGTLSSAFPAGKTWIMVHASDAGENVNYAQCIRSSTDVVQLFTSLTDHSAEDVFSELSIEIRVYP